VEVLVKLIFKKCIFICSLLFLCCISNTSNETKTDASAVVDEFIDETPEPVMVVFQGDLLNIFFHPVVAIPEIGFTGDMKDHFLEWFVSADEYRRILWELYEQDYVLIDINEFYDVTYNDGRKIITTRDLLVPEGKRPIILSIDDLNYYPSMRRNGVVHKLVLDEKGNIAAWTDNDEGGVISYDDDIITITEDFIRQHPGFSIRGARGIIALTGYMGVLGYQIQRLNAPDHAEQVERATAVANRLKEMGWRFASHGWAHLNMRETPMDSFINDTNLWDRYVRPITGDTDLYIYPFGPGVERIPEKHRILRERNFNIFFGVGSGYDIIEGGDFIYMSRKNIDGFYFRTYRNRENRIFNIDRVIDRRFR
jgi:hypothetical protein